jgi:hypothetical protein
MGVGVIHRMTDSASRRAAEDKADEIPKSWRDATFSEDPRDRRRLQLAVPQKYREWLVSQRTQREAFEKLPIYRIPQQAYLLYEHKRNPHAWATDSEGRLYGFVPKGDEAHEVLGGDVRSGEWFMYVVLTQAKAEFPRDAFTLVKPRRMQMRVVFADFPQHHAVGLLTCMRYT